MFRRKIRLLSTFILEDLIDELSDELKLSWHSSSRWITHLWYLCIEKLNFVIVEFGISRPNNKIITLPTIETFSTIPDEL